MTTTIVIWIIGWLFTFGFVTEDETYQNHVDGVGFKIFVFFLTAISWPITLGSEVHCAWKEIKRWKMEERI